MAHCWFCHLLELNNLNLVKGYGEGRSLQRVCSLKCVCIFQVYFFVIGLISIYLHCVSNTYLKTIMHAAWLYSTRRKWGTLDEPYMNQPFNLIWCVLGEKCGLGFDWTCYQGYYGASIWSTAEEDVYTQRCCKTFVLLIQNTNVPLWWCTLLALH